MTGGGCGGPSGPEAPALEVEIVGRGEAAVRLRRRLACAAGALGVRLSIHQDPDDLRAAELGARHGPLVLLGGRVIADGPEPVEVIQQRLAHSRGPVAPG